jgi:hypothetical protein
MKRFAIFCNAFCFLMVVPSADVCAQFNYKSDWGIKDSSSDPRVRRANREKAVARLGPIARDFVETYDEAVAAIFACDKAVGVKLAEFHASGGLAKLPRPRDLLRALADPRQSDDVALWAIAHATELADPDSFTAFLASPLEYALGLKQLQAGAATVRAKRLDPTATTAMEATPVKHKWFLETLTDDDRVGITACVCLVILAILAARRKRQSQAY